MRPVGEPSIHVATAADVPALASLLDGHGGAGLWRTGALQEEIVRPQSVVRVARRAGHVKGVALGRIAVDELTVLDVVVQSSERRRGLGARLVAALVAAAEEARCARVLLEVRADNDAARRLYARAGFVVVGRRPRYYPDGQDAELMTLDLG